MSQCHARYDQVIDLFCSNGKRQAHVFNLEAIFDFSFLGDHPDPDFGRAYIRAGPRHPLLPLAPIHQAALQQGIPLLPLVRDSLSLSARTD